MASISRSVASYRSFASISYARAILYLGMIITPLLPRRLKSRALLRQSPPPHGALTGQDRAGSPPPQRFSLDTAAESHVTQLVAERKSALGGPARSTLSARCAHSALVMSRRRRHRVMSR